MDLVRELKEVRFELSLRGYDCEAVDAFLAKIRADLTTVQGENDAAKGRIAELESVVESGGGSSETEGTLRRTLLLAQRLADETEAEAKKAAEELAQKSAAEAEQMRASAEVESSSMRAEGERELSNARDEAATIRETSAEEAARARGEARIAAEQVLSSAEERGMERVAALEQTAQEEAATMREPIRSEVAELEGVRSRLLGDIAALERHLEEQRVRVRTAVEALRVGMSGSIQDLERVAEDDELLATQAGPETSGAGAADVTVAPDIEIVERVAESAPQATTVDDIEAAVDATPIEVPLTQDDVDDPFEDLATERLPVVEIDDTIGAESAEEIVAEAVPVDDAPVDDAPVDELIIEDSTVEEVDAASDVVVASEDDLAEAELIELDEEPSALFGTELSADADLTDVMPDDSPAAAFIDGGAADGPFEEDPSAEGEAEPAEEQVIDAPGFVDRFTELLDALPIGRDE